MGRLAVALAVIGAVLLPFLPLASLVVLVCAIACALFVKVRVDVDSEGVRVTGPVGLPRVRFPHTLIESVSAIDVRPMKRGGWGYRGSLMVFHRAAWIVRAGPGLQLDLRGGRRFIVTVDCPEQAARLLSGGHDVEAQ